ncbi:UDP-N-acetylmuramate--L-alanine ligase [Gordonia sp. OPL2]|uniref:UDP-N-acetylmuramate--L-alanine ligase n=1 Tax=Gordonia sp. OPL2 TaxID=2486274 RepID=UPI00165681E0|nr:UDP-N-acetylmuramate--L-alanine ligase [Gordonia sp. OPL2]ROZ83830.1 UDP-N-acetylmuramate--L-alanine ligase [Gordonia sp. OPL2]
MSAHAPTGELPEQLRRVHMVGIGGAGMSGLARILLARGGQVSGSDAKNSRGILALRTRGARIQVGHDPSALDQIPGGPSVVVTTHAAIPKTNPELVAARSRGIPILLRPRVLAELMAGYRTVLMAGTHGKTSTTSIAVVALQHCGLDPSFAVGGELNESGTNAHHGNGGIFVAEADESDGSLLEYTPDVVVVTNIEVDHLDFFGSREAYVQVFDAFAERIADGGSLIVCLDDEGAAEFAGRCAESLAARGISVLGYGDGRHADRAPTAIHVARLESWDARGAGGQARVRFDAPLSDGPTDRTIALTVPGRHMALNALGAIVACVRAGAALDDVVRGVEAFGGVHRRFEFRGRTGDVDVFDDYAHHPTEVRAVLTAARLAVESTAAENVLDADDGSGAAAVRPGRVIAVFQPHLFSRTQEFAGDFAAALDLADQVVVADVYGAREQPIPGISGASIADRVTRPVVFVPDLSALARTVASIALPGDLILTLGAGDITMQGPEILAALETASAGATPAPGAEAGAVGLTVDDSAAKPADPRPAAADAPGPTP